MKKKAGTRFLLVVLLAVLAAFLTMVFLARARAETSVVVAAGYIEAGTRLDESLLEVKRIHPGAALPGAVKDPAQLAGKVLQVQRMPGDQVTLDMVGDTGGSAIAAGLAPDHRAIAINVTRATGVLGVLRTGDLVDVVATVDAGLGAGSVSAVVVRGARVLVVPQAFRYQEAPVTGEKAGLLPAETTTRQSEQNTVVLDVPITPIAVTLGYTDTVTHQFVPPVEMSPVELLALLNARATLHLVLRPPEAVDAMTPPATLQKLLEALGMARGTPASSPPAQIAP